MFLQRKYWSVILLATVSTVEAQQHHFTNPQVRVQVNQKTLNVSTTGYPDHKWKRSIPTDLKNKILISNQL